MSHRNNKAVTYVTNQQHQGFTMFFEKPTREALRSLSKGKIGETDYLDNQKKIASFVKTGKIYSRSI